jgi:hypothetical protein
VIFEGWSSWETTSISIPPAYAAVQGSGVVLELPFGVCDGRKKWGVAYPPEQLYYQAEHHHPVMGGYLSRVPEKVFSGYQQMPALAWLVESQSGEANLSPVSPHVFSDWLKVNGVRWIILDRRLSSLALVKNLEEIRGPADFSDENYVRWDIKDGNQEKKWS